MDTVDEEYRDLVKRMADEREINLQDVQHINIYPSPPVEPAALPSAAEEREKRGAEEEKLVSIEERSTPEEDVERDRFFLITLRSTTSTTSTSVTTTTVTIGITGTTSACTTGSISTYFSKCG